MKTMNTTRMAVWTLLLIPTVALTENFTIRSSHQPIRGTVGHDVILPCYVEPPFNVTRRTVDWKFGSKFVYVYRHNGHDPDHQHADFKNRTYVDEDEMSKGNLSLRIFPLKKTDAGNYTCSVPEQSGKVMKVNTELIVAEDKMPNKIVSSSLGIGTGIGMVSLIMIMVIIWNS